MSVNVEHITFGVLMAANLGLGLYFAFSRRARKAPTADEVFLGSRTMGTLPLAMSVLASMISAIGVIGFGAHYYAHGFHYAWSLVSAPLLVPVVTLVVIPVLYKLRVTSVFEVGAHRNWKSLLDRHRTGFARNALAIVPPPRFCNGAKRFAERLERLESAPVLRAAYEL